MGDIGDAIKVAVTGTSECASTFTKLGSWVALFVGFSFEIVALLDFDKFNKGLPLCCGNEMEDDNGFVVRLVKAGIGFSVAHVIFSAIYLLITDNKIEEHVKATVVCLKLMTTGATALILLYVIGANAIIFYRVSFVGLILAELDAIIALVALLVSMVLEIKQLLVGCMSICCISACFCVSFLGIIAQLIICALVFSGTFPSDQSFCYYSDDITFDDDADHPVNHCSYNMCLSVNNTASIVETYQSHRYGTVTEYCYSSGSYCCYWQR